MNTSSYTLDMTKAECTHYLGGRETTDSAHDVKCVSGVTGLYSASPEGSKFKVHRTNRHGTGYGHLSVRLINPDVSTVEMHVNGNVVRHKMKGSVCHVRKQIALGMYWYLDYCKESWEDRARRTWDG